MNNIQDHLQQDRKRNDHPAGQLDERKLDYGTDRVGESLNFEQSLARLEEIVKQLDDGRTDLETSLARYEEGVKLLRRCHGILESAQRRIEILRGVDSDGNPITEQVGEQAFKTV